LKEKFNVISPLNKKPQVIFKSKKNLRNNYYFGPQAELVTPETEKGRRILCVKRSAQEIRRRFVGRFVRHKSGRIPTICHVKKQHKIFELMDSAGQKKTHIALEENSFLKCRFLQILRPHKKKRHI
jgi:hypothetical protein